ncbi:MAG TPA: hypothetical protein VK203_27510 [Nostocaceae cyanobacterium]|nr:hypothetical protein [Nostocaceae cyanobacterium]
MAQTLAQKPVSLFPWGIYRQTEEGSWLIVARFRNSKDAEDYQKTLKRISTANYKLAYDAA